MAQELILPDIQRDCEVRMNSDPFFTYISVLNHRKGDISQELNAALCGLAPKNGRSGAAVVILQPVAKAANRNVRFPPFEVTLSFLVFEYPLFNDDASTGTTARGEMIGRRLLDLFAQFHPVGVTTPLTPDEPFMIPRRIPVPSGIDGEDLLPNCWECAFTFRESRGRSLNQPQLPLITIGAQVTISCATDAVDIYYTLDGSPPGPPSVSPGSTLYTGPFTPLTSVVVRAVALRQQVGSDWTPSDINMADWDVSLADNLNNPINPESDQGATLGV